MYESLGELPRTTHELSQENGGVKQKINKLPGGKIIDPSILGFTLERAESIHEEFEKRIEAETDIKKVVDGILPLEVILIPTCP